uniref:Uncharacterized protein n=1 Tax=Eiseniibacteriota bacterium TaxID=2212470 RepID=A0A832I0U4_UNCEI
MPWPSGGGATCGAWPGVPRLRPARRAERPRPTPTRRPCACAGWTTSRGSSSPTSIPGGARCSCASPTRAPARAAAATRWPAAARTTRRAR